MLAGALLAGSAVASLALQRATRGLTAAARAEWEGRRALGEVVARWDGAADSLAVGGWLDRPLPVPAVGGSPLAARARLRRLTANIYAVTVSVQVGEGASALAQREMRLLLARAPTRDSAAAANAPPPVRWWSVMDLQ